MTHASLNSHSANDLSRPALSEPKAAARCQHRTRRGRRCRIRVAGPDSPLCFRHSALCAAKGIQFGRQAADLTPELVGQLTEFKSAVDINRVLSNLLLLISRDRIAPRRASVVAYTCNLLLQSLVAIDFELHPPVGKDEEIVQIIVDTPRPDRTQRSPDAQASPNA
jgi:hypothetical protein